MQSLCSDATLSGPTSCSQHLSCTQCYCCYRQRIPSTMTNTLGVVLAQMTCYCHKSEITDRGLVLGCLGTRIHSTQGPNQVTYIIPCCGPCLMYTQQIVHCKLMQDTRNEMGGPLKFSGHITQIERVTLIGVTASVLKHTHATHTYIHVWTAQVTWWPCSPSVN